MRKHPTFTRGTPSWQLGQFGLTDLALATHAARVPTRSGNSFWVVRCAGCKLSGYPLLVRWIGFEFEHGILVEG